eukprot:SAG31_NODE_142_length_22669_cov_18.630040_3_plen_178_part_00
MKTSFFTVLFVLGGGACAAASAAASAMMAAAVTADGSTSVEMGGGLGAVCLLLRGGSRTRGVPPSDAGYGSSLYMLQADVLSTANLTGGVAVSTAASGSPGSSHNDLYTDLQRGSGGENKIGTPPSVRGLGCAPAQSFPNKCSSVLRADGGCSGGGGSFSLPLGPRIPWYSCFYVRL